jgi:hypothetical protein
MLRCFPGRNSSTRFLETCAGHRTCPRPHSMIRRPNSAGRRRSSLVDGWQDFLTTNKPDVRVSSTAEGLERTVLKYAVCRNRSPRSVLLEKVRCTQAGYLAEGSSRPEGPAANSRGLQPPDSKGSAPRHEGGAGNQNLRDLLFSHTPSTHHAPCLPAPTPPRQTPNPSRPPRTPTRRRNR